MSWFNVYSIHVHYGLRSVLGGVRILGEIRIGLTVGWHPYSVSVSVFVLENVMSCVGRDLVLRIRICIRVTAIRNTDTDTEYGTVTINVSALTESSGKRSLREQPATDVRSSSEAKKTDRDLPGITRLMLGIHRIQSGYPAYRP